jgi:regulatory protein YycI of two-component signal transduction system YycFG
MTKETKIVGIIIFIAIYCLLNRLHDKKVYIDDSKNLMNTYLSIKLPKQTIFTHMSLSSNAGYPSFWGNINPGGQDLFDQLKSNMDKYDFVFKKKYSGKAYAGWIFMKDNKKYHLQIYENGAVEESLIFSERY